MSCGAVRCAGPQQGKAKPKLVLADDRRPAVRCAARAGGLERMRMASLVNSCGVVACVADGWHVDQHGMCACGTADCTACVCHGLQALCLGAYCRQVAERCNLRSLAGTALWCVTRAAHATPWKCHAMPCHATRGAAVQVHRGIRGIRGTGRACGRRVHGHAMQCRAMPCMMHDAWRCAEAGCVRMHACMPASLAWLAGCCGPTRVKPSRTSRPSEGDCVRGRGGAS